MGALKKLTIIGYKDEKFSTPTGNSFETELNPGYYKRGRGIRYRNNSGMNRANMPVFYGYGDDTIDFEFMLDATGVFINWMDCLNGNYGENESVSGQVEQLEKTIYDYNGSAHQPSFFKIIWGDLEYNCRLLNMDLDYMLFNSGGEPLRVKIKLSLQQYVDQQIQAVTMNMQSSDMTHIVTVKAGDTLPLLCQKIYQSSAYCMEIARINNLTGLRRLEPGVRLLFPPLSNN